jgi:hypothetical protein
MVENIIEVMVTGKKNAVAFLLCRYLAKKYTEE